MAIQSTLPVSQVTQVQNVYTTTQVVVIPFPNMANPQDDNEGPIESDAESWDDVEDPWLVEYSDSESDDSETDYDSYDEPEEDWDW